MRAPQRTTAGRLASRRANRREAAILDLSKQCLQALYDFSVDAGAVGTVSFGAKLPAGAVVTSISADVITGATSAGSATFQIKAGSTDLTADTAFDSATAGINVAGVLSIPLNVSAPFDSIKLAAASELKMSIETAALTAGKVRWCVEFYVSKDL